MRRRRNSWRRRRRRRRRSTRRRSTRRRRSCSTVSRRFCFPLALYFYLPPSIIITILINVTMGVLVLSFLVKML